jgi:hypothetical protein
VLRYMAPLAVAASRTGGAARVTWTLPGWEAGLDRGAIEIAGASGLQPVQDPELAQQIERTEQGGQPGVRFARVHVPRASPWTVAVDVPAGALAGGHEASAPVVIAPVSGPRARTGALLALGLLLLVLLQRRQSRAGGAPYLGVGPCFALAALGALCWVHAPPLALVSWSVLCWAGVARRQATHSALPLGRVVALEADALARLSRQARSERLGAPFGDIASWLGAGSALGLIGVVVSSEGALTPGGDAWGLGALCALFAAIAGSRLWSPRSSAEQTRLLLRAARRARVLECALGLCEYVAEGRPLHPRLRLVPSVRHPGLLRLEVLVHARRSETPLWLSAVVEAESAAERWLRALRPGCVIERSAGGQRVALRWPIEEVGQAAAQLLDRLAQESQRYLGERVPARSAA